METRKLVKLATDIQSINERINVIKESLLDEYGVDVTTQEHKQFVLFNLYKELTAVQRKADRTLYFLADDIMSEISDNELPFEDELIDTTF